MKQTTGLDVTYAGDPHHCHESPKALDTLSALTDEQGWWRLADTGSCRLIKAFACACTERTGPPKEITTEYDTIRLKNHVVKSGCCQGKGRSPRERTLQQEPPAETLDARSSSARLLGEHDFCLHPSIRVRHSVEHFPCFQSNEYCRVDGTAQ